MAGTRKPKRKPKAESARAKAARANGARGGRPRLKQPGPGEPDWREVQRIARVGADRETITLAAGITPEQLRDVNILSRLQQEIACGHAKHRADVLEALKLQATRDGKVNAGMGIARQILGFDQKDRGGSEQRPDTEAAVAQIENMLERLFRAPR